MDEQLDGLWRDASLEGDLHTSSSPAPAAADEGAPYWMIQKTSTVGGPVTCVSIPSDEVCCYAQGSCLERVNLTNNQQQDRLVVFGDGTLLHGIRHDDDYSENNNYYYTAVFGGRQVAILSNVLLLDRPMKNIPLLLQVLNGSSQRKTIQTLTFADWIWDIQWLSCSQNTNNNAKKKEEEEWHLLVGLAHNVVEKWTFTPTINGDTMILLQATKTGRWMGTKRCLLYCLDFDVSTSSNSAIMSKVAVGTAMQDIRIWTIKAQESSSAKEKVSDAVSEDACLLGHHGVIHGVKWVPSTNNNHGRSWEGQSQLVSASDDRSIRLWGIQESSPLQEWQCLWVGWGHTARIWGLGVLARPQHPTIIVSSGEDSTVRLWNGQTGAALETLRGHSCQCIWSVDVNRASGMAVSGGNDGTVSFYDINDVSTNGTENSATGKNDQRSYSYLQFHVVVPDDRIKSQMSSECVNENSSIEECAVLQDVSSEPCPPHKPKKKKKKKHDTGQVLVGMKFYAPEQMIVATRSGSLFAVDMTSSNPTWVYLGSWSQPTSLEGLGPDTEVDASSGCTMICRVSMDVAKQRCLEVAIGTTQGSIVILLVPVDAIASAPRAPKDGVFISTRDIVQKSAFRYRFVLRAPQEYRAVQWLAWQSVGESLEHSGSIELLSFHVSTVLSWTVPTANEEASSVTSHPVWVFNLETQAIPSSYAYDKIHRRLFVGDTRGNLIMFHPDLQDVSRLCTPSATLSRLHGKEHVTDIAVVTQDINCAARSTQCKVLTVGNDGYIHESYFDSTTRTLRKGLAVSASSSLTGISRVAVITTSSSVTQGEEIILSGYFGNTFVLINVTRGYELFRADTGGRQRQQDFFSSFTPWNSSGPTMTAVDSHLGSLAVCAHQKETGRNEIVVHTRRLRQRRNDTSWQQHKYSQGVGLHGESIYSSCFFTYLTTNGEQRHALLTGSEDCTSKIAFYHDGTLVAAKQLPAQESCVRAVCSSYGNSDSGTLLAVGGGKLTLQFFLVSSGNSPADMQVYFIGFGKTSTKSSIDHRINDVKAVLLDNGLENDETPAPQHLVAAGDSEGCCYIYKVTAEIEARRHSWTGLPLPLSGSDTKPVLSVELLKIKSRVLLLTGTTGGDIGIWDLPATTNATEWDALCRKTSDAKSIEEFPARRIGTYNAHQMGVNSISATLVVGKGDCVLVCSGGDDQAISLCELYISFNEDGTGMESGRVVKLTTNKEASSSAIKGVKMLDDGKRVISAGYTQRLAFWKVTTDTKEIELISSAPVSSGDVNCLSSTNFPTRGDDCIVAVCGASVDLFCISCRPANEVS